MAQINGPIVAAVLTAVASRGGGVVLTGGTASDPTFRAAPPGAAGALIHGIVIRTPNGNTGAIGDVVSVHLLAGAILPVRVDAAVAVGTACECMTDGRFGAAESGDERHAILLEASTAADQIVTALVGVFGRAP